MEFLPVKPKNGLKRGEKHKNGAWPHFLMIKFAGFVPK